MGHLFPQQALILKPPFPVLISASVFVVQKDQLNLQSVEILSLRDSLHVEQQRYRQLWDDRETMVTRLHSQIRQLQQGRDDYYTKNQELQVETHTLKDIQWIIY